MGRIKHCKLQKNDPKKVLRLIHINEDPEPPKFPYKLFFNVPHYTPYKEEFTDSATLESQPPSQSQTE